MKKTILALAVLGAFVSSAQAQVTVGGVIQVNIKDYKVGNTTLATRSPSNELRVDDDYTSRFWLTGTEDLGGGNSALFYIENRFNADVSNTQGIGNGLGNGDTFVGLKGGWGQLTAGKHTMLYAQGIMTEMGGNGINAAPSSMWGTFTMLSELNGAYITPSRISNSVMYRLPNLKGFNGSAGFSTNASGTEGNLNCTGGGQQNYVTSAAAGPTGCNTPSAAGNSGYSNGQAYYLQGGYASGPLYLNLAYWNMNFEGRPAVVGAGNADQRELRFSGSYAIPGGLKVGLQIDRASFLRVGQTAVLPGADLTRTAWEVPVSYTFGANTLLASYTHAGSASGTTATGAKMWVAGWDYALSKRTNVGIFYSKLSNDTAGTYQPFLAGTSATGSALAPGESASTFALGVKHTF
ncbi:MAG: porin [Burkholderiaceae bacterium]